jgi:Carboxypeptidase regulatory-like domain/TonB-dependent Receptor Plug Domain
MSMRRGWFLGVLVLAVVVSFVPSLPAQESAAKGSLNGSVVDSTGGAIVGAQVTVAGPEGIETQTTNGAGVFIFPVLIPGTYMVKVEMKDFRALQVPNVVVNVGSVTAIRLQLQPGPLTQTVVVESSSVAVDTTSTAVATNLDDTLYEKLPLQRGVASLFYLAPGAVSGGGTGQANPSISGGSGLENLYVADGVSITDTAFGGLGLYSRVYGSVGTGINLAFVKEVQIKTGAFQPQYGGATGGVVQIVTKSGSHDYHGAIAGYYQPQQLEAQRLNADDFNLVNPFGKVLHNANADLSGEIGGSVPKLRDKLFFFGSINPSETQKYEVAPPGFGLNLAGELTGRQLTYNYAAKLTYKINGDHSIEGSVFGDPTRSNTYPWSRLTEGTRGVANRTNWSKLTYGNRDVVARYNGALSPTWTLNISATWQHNKFTEGGYDNSISRIRDETQILGLAGQQGVFTSAGQGFVENTRDESFGENINTTKIFNFIGQHSFDVGYQHTKAIYDAERANSGPVAPIPVANEKGTPLPGNAAWAGQFANYYWRLVARPTCSDTECPLMTVPGFGAIPVALRSYRSEFGVAADGFKHTFTHSLVHVGYINDTWTVNKYVTLNAGLRWQQERLVGQDANYTFTDDWSPRIGVNVDPIGDRKNKIFFNFGRYSYNLPLDLAQRSLTNELDMGGLRLAPNYTTDAGGVRHVVLNSFGTVTPIVDAAHTLNLVPGAFRTTGVGASLSSIEAIHSGTHSTYEDEYVIGAEHEFSHGIVLTARYMHRSLRRIVEDSGGISPEAAQAGISQQFSIINPARNTDLYVNPVEHDFVATTDPITGAVNNAPAACGAPPAVPTGSADFVAFPITDSFGNPITDPKGNTAACFNESQDQTVAGTVNAVPVGKDGKSVAGSLAPDGIVDGFSDPVRKYWAVEFELNKTFSHNWQLRANYRIAKLFGNFEGAFRNDNGQSDPGISSLFDFTPGNFNLLGNQFLPGVLNTDRQQVANGYFSYVFDQGKLKNLTLGTGVRVETGTPVNELAAHPSPIYANPGEVPIGGRGSQGRTPTSGSVDFHGDYALKITEKARLRFGVDMFNIANTKRVVYINQNIDLGLGSPNLDFLKPTIIAVRGDAIQSPFNARVFFRFEF